MSLPIQPLPLVLFNDARNMGVTHISIEVRGGADYGVYTAVCTDKEGNQAELLSKKVESWAPAVYGINGAGDGVDYGWDFEYDLEDMTVECSEWTEGTEEVTEVHDGEEYTYETGDGSKDYYGTSAEEMAINQLVPTVESSRWGGSFTTWR